MARLKQSREVTGDANLRKAIRGSAAYYRMSADEQAYAAGVTKSTYYRRLRAPGTFTIHEFRSMIRRFHWDNETIIEILR